MDSQKEIGDGGEDHFNRLPNDVLLLIFNKIVDAKTLIRCLSVSKNFASLITKTDTLSIPTDFRHNYQHSNGNNIFKKLFNNIFMRSKVDQHTPRHEIVDVIKKFPEVQSLQIFDKRVKQDGCEDFFVKWKAVFGSSLETCVVLFADKSNRRNIIKEEMGWEDMEENNGVIKTCLYVAAGTFLDYLRYGFIQSRHKKLKSVVISDGSGEGKVCLEEEQLGKLQGTGVVLKLPLMETGIPYCVKLWYVPVLELPSCGCRLKEVVLAVIRDGDDDQLIIMERDVQSLLGAFTEAEQGKICDEAVKEVMNSNRKKTYS